jgi:hypothetical protein
MARSIFDVLLNFLPGNLSQSPDNPLQVDRLPKTSDVELDYPVYQGSRNDSSQQLLTILMLASLVAPLLTWTGHFIPVPFIYGGVHTLVLIAAGAITVRGLAGPIWPQGSLILAAAVIPILAFLVQELPFALATAVVALIALAFLGDRLVATQLYFKTAAPLSKQQARSIRAVWTRRWTAIVEPLRGCELYFAGYLVLIPACWLILRSVAATGGFGDFHGATLLFVQLTALGFVWYWLLEFMIAPFFGRPRYSLRSAIGAVWRALALWFSYNRRKSHGAGVHVSPAGNCMLRRLTLVGIIAAWSCLWAGVQLYVPPDFNELLQKNISILQEVYPQFLGELVHEPEATNETIPDSELFQLSPQEQDFLKRAAPEEAEKYLAERRVLATAELNEAEAAQRAEQSRQTAENLLVLFFKRLGVILIHVVTPSLGVLLACLSFLVAIAGRSLAAIEERFSTEFPGRIYTSDNWENLVARIRTSEDSIEKESVLLGSNARDDTPILVPRSVFAEHTHILGDSGSGKTSRGILPLITQLIRFEKASVIVLDLKADDQSVFETLRIEAEALSGRLKKDAPDHPGFPFRWFTTVLDRSSFAFNPLTQRMMPKLDPDQRTDVLTAALGLQYGSDYGRKYFGDANFDVLNYALREYPNVESLAELAQILSGAEYFPLPKKTKEAASNVQSSVRRLSRFKALNACVSQRTPQAVLDHAIDLDDLFTTPQALYVALPPAAGISNTAEIARIFLYALLAAAQSHGPSRKQVYLVVDEFQRIVSKNVELFLQTARSMNIGCILANQSLADLNSIGADLIPAVRTNCRVRQIFGAGNYDDILDILGTSGEAMYAIRNWSLVPGTWNPLLKGMSITETRGTRISINDILLATDAPGRNITYIRRGDGYAQFGGMPFLMDSVHHIDEREYKKRKEFEWPKPDERMLVSTLADSVLSPPNIGGILGESAPDPGELLADHGSPLVKEPSDDSTEELWEALDTEYAQQKALHEEKLRRRRQPPGLS